MTRVSDLNAFRQKHYLELASAQGWVVEPQSAEPLAKVWIYSVHIDGTVRAAGQLLQSTVTALTPKKASTVNAQDIQLAGTAVDLLIEKSDEIESRQMALSALAHYFARTKTLQAVPIEARQTGIHQVVIDWPAPGTKTGHILRPSLAIMPTMMTPEQLQYCVAAVITAEREKHPERLPKEWRTQKNGESQQ